MKRFPWFGLFVVALNFIAAIWLRGDLIAVVNAMVVGWLFPGWWDDVEAWRRLSREEVS